MVIAKLVCDFAYGRLDRACVQQQARALEFL